MQYECVENWLEMDMVYYAWESVDMKSIFL